MEENIIKMEQVTYEKLPGIARIWLDNPANENRLTRISFDEIKKSFRMATEDPEVRVIIFGAKGDNFCCGFDVGDPDKAQIAEPTWAERTARTGEEVDFFMEIFNSRKPVIGAIHGNILGGGYFMVMCFDMLIAAENICMDNDEMAIGCSYTDYVPFEAWKVPMHIAFEHAMTGAPIRAKEGFRIGLYNHITTRETVDDAALYYAKKMCRLDPNVLSFHMQVYNSVYNAMGLHTILPYAREAFSISRMLPGTKANQEMNEFARTHSGREYVQLFADKLAEYKAEVAEEEAKIGFLDDKY